MEPLLKVEGLTKRFGGSTAVQDLSMKVDQGIIVGLIGPNGSGKTTSLNLLNGAYAPTSGAIELRGKSLAGKNANAFVEAGISRTFQNPRVFATLSSLENMVIPVLHRRGSTRSWREKSMALLSFVGLAEKADIAASALSGGQQKLLEFVRALMTDPALVLMDEPFAGVHPSIKDVMRQRIRERNDEGTSFVIVSHEIPDLMRLCSHVVCMASGSLIASGTPEAVVAEPQVIEAYLGQAGASRMEAGA